MRLTGLVFSILSFWVVAAEAEADDLVDVLAMFNAHAVYPIPVLTASQRDKLGQGKLVRFRQTPTTQNPAHRGIGLQILEHPRHELWTGAVDPHMAYSASIVEIELAPAGSVHRWYQRLWLPWPFAQRHWVIDVADNQTMVVASQGQAWEHHWSLNKDGPAMAKALIASGKAAGVTPETASSFVYTPVNRGGYFAIVLSETQTLWGFHASTVIGGNVSDRLVAQFTMMQLKGMFADVVSRSLKAKSHYVTGHAPLRGGDGMELPMTSAP